MDDKAFLDTLEAKVAEEIPGYESRYKEESFFQKLIGVLAWPFNRHYMDRYTTTMYPRVYFPERSWRTDHTRRVWKILTHEYVHLWDQKQHRVLYPVGYALPQVLALMSLGAIGAFWGGLGFLWFLAFLVFALPWPAKWRTAAEMRGYAMSMAVNYWRYGTVTESQKEHVVARFVGWDYYRMSASKKKTRARVEAYVKALEDDSILFGKKAEPYRVMYNLLKDNGIIGGGA